MKKQSEVNNYAKPVRSFALSLVGAFFIIIGGLGNVIPGITQSNNTLVILGTLGVVCSVLTMAGAVMINSNKASNIKKGSILVLVFSILSWVGAAGGFFFGFVLGLIGAILGLRWKPKTRSNTDEPN